MTESEFEFLFRLALKGCKTRDDVFEVQVQSGFFGYDELQKKIMDELDLPYECDLEGFKGE